LKEFSLKEFVLRRTNPWFRFWYRCSKSSPFGPTVTSLDKTIAGIKLTNESLSESTRLSVVEHIGRIPDLHVTHEDVLRGSSTEGSTEFMSARLTDRVQQVKTPGQAVIYHACAAAAAFGGIKDLTLWSHSEQVTAKVHTLHNELHWHRYYIHKILVDAKAEDPQLYQPLYQMWLDVARLWAIPANGKPCVDEYYDGVRSQYTRVIQTLVFHTQLLWAGPSGVFGALTFLAQGELKTAYQAAKDTAKALKEAAVAANAEKLNWDLNWLTWMTAIISPATFPVGSIPPAAPHVVALLVVLRGLFLFIKKAWEANTWRKASAPNLRNFIDCYRLFDQMYVMAMLAHDYEVRRGKYPGLPEPKSQGPSQVPTPPTEN
jgi:hypothetical protein